MRRLTLWVGVLVAAVVVVSGLLACGRASGSIAAPHSPDVRWDGSPVRTDSLSYTLRRLPGSYRAYVQATYRNTTGAPVYFRRCDSRDPLPMYDIRRTGPDSVLPFFVDAVWACVGGVPAGVIAAGDSVTVRVSLGSVDQPRMSPPLRAGDLTGALRIALHLCARPGTDSASCELLPQAKRQSNPFVVRY